MVTCLLRGADLHTDSCFSKIQIGFTFLVPAHLGSRGQRPLNVLCVLCAAKYQIYRKQ